MALGDGVRWVDIPENIDIAFVIDASGDMSKHGFAIKNLATDFVRKISDIRLADGFKIAKLRAKLITFTDFITDGADAIKQTEFFDLPNEADKLDAAFCDLQFSGGGEFENGFEALWTAVNTDWYFPDQSATVAQERNMRFIVLISDAPPLKLHERDGAKGYDPSAYPNDVAKIEEVWRRMHANVDSSKAHNYGTVLLIVPTESDWSRIAEWSRTVAYDFSKALDDGFTLDGFYEFVEYCFAPTFGMWDSE